MAPYYRMPPLISMRAFEAFSRHGLVRAAAEELSVSHTVVSRHIQNLEAAMKVELVCKNGRNIVLTPAGVRFAEQINRAFGIISAAASNLRRGDESTLHLACMHGLASRRILPVLSYMEEEIGVGSITLQPQLLGSELFRGDADVELGYNDIFPTIPGLKTEIFASPRLIPVASPEFIRNHGPVRRLADMARLPLLLEKSPAQWQIWLAKAGLADVPDLRGVRLWHGHLTIEGAKIGQGIALVSTLIAKPSLEEGELVEVFPSNVRLGDYYMMAMPQVWERPEIRKLHDWLVRTFAND